MRQAALKPAVQPPAQVAPAQPPAQVAPVPPAPADAPFGVDAKTGEPLPVPPAPEEPEEAKPKLLKAGDTFSLPPDSVGFSIDLDFPKNWAGRHVETYLEIRGDQYYPQREASIRQDGKVELEAIGGWVREDVRNRLILVFKERKDAEGLRGVFQAPDAETAANIVGGKPDLILSIPEVNEDGSALVYILKGTLPAPEEPPVPPAPAPEAGLGDKGTLVYYADVPNFLEPAARELGVRTVSYRSQDGQEKTILLADNSQERMEQILNVLRDDMGMNVHSLVRVTTDYPTKTFRLDLGPGLEPAAGMEEQITRRDAIKAIVGGAVLTGVAASKLAKETDPFSSPADSSTPAEIPPFATVKEAEETLQRLAKTWNLTQFPDLRVLAVTPDILQINPRLQGLLGKPVALGNASFLVVPPDSEERNRLLQSLTQEPRFVFLQGFGSPEDPTLNAFEASASSQGLSVTPRLPLTSQTFREILRQLIANLSGLPATSIQIQDLIDLERALLTLA